MRAHALGALENDVINVGSENEITILELARTVVRLTGSNSSIEFLPPLSEGDMTRRCPDISKMRHLLDRPLVTLENGIRRLIEHYRTDTSTSAKPL